jgi:hypothetical protein
MSQVNINEYFCGENLVQGRATLTVATLLIALVAMLPWSVNTAADNCDYQAFLLADDIESDSNELPGTHHSAEYYHFDNLETAAAPPYIRFIHKTATSSAEAHAIRAPPQHNRS